MDRDEMVLKEIDSNYIDILKEAQEKFSSIVIPSMGIIDNEKKIEIDGKKFIDKGERSGTDEEVQ